eukprot:409744-Rhodomonas_salina.3
MQSSHCRHFDSVKEFAGQIAIRKSSKYQSKVACWSQLLRASQGVERLLAGSINGPKTPFCITSWQLTYALRVNPLIVTTTNFQLVAAVLTKGTASKGYKTGESSMLNHDTSVKPQPPLPPRAIRVFCASGPLPKSWILLRGGGAAVHEQYKRNGRRSVWCERV